MTAQVLIAVGSVIALFILTHAVGRFASRHFWSPETQRKVVHVGVGLHAMLIPYLLDRRGFLVFVVLALAALLLLRTAWAARTGASIHSVARRSWGDILFLVAVSVLFLRAPGDPVLYILPIGVLTLSDAAAAIIGTEYGRRRFGEGDRVKSIEGTTAFFVITWMFSVTLLIFATEVDRYNVFWIATVIATLAAMIEADSWHGFDNLFVPVGVHTILVSWADADPARVAGMSLLWLTALAGARLVAPRLNIERHSFRATFIALSLSAALVPPVHLILPAAALVCHAIARQMSQIAGTALDFVAVLVLIGVCWLIVAALAGRPTIEFYGMAFAALAAGYAAMAVPGQSLALRLAAALAAAAAATAFHRWLGASLPDAERWLPRQIALAACAANAVLCGLAGALRPACLMGRAPGAKLGVAAMVLPILTFALEASR